MKNIFFACTILFTTMLFSQDGGTIKGTILDEEMNSEPLLFAEVIVKNTDWSAQTNLHGNFELTNITPGTYTLVINYLGYESSELPIHVEENKTTYVSDGLHAKRIFTDDIAQGTTSSNKHVKLVSVGGQK